MFDDNGTWNDMAGMLVADVELPAPSLNKVYETGDGIGIYVGGNNDAFYWEE